VVYAIACINKSPSKGTAAELAAGVVS